MRLTSKLEEEVSKDKQKFVKLQEGEKNARQAHNKKEIYKSNVILKSNHHENMVLD
jgi:hypothetical protein